MRLQQMTQSGQGAFRRRREVVADFPDEPQLRRVADAAVDVDNKGASSLAFNSSKRSWDFSRAFLEYSFLGGGLGFGAPKPALSFVCRFVCVGCCSAVTVVSARSALYILFGTAAMAY